MGSRCQLARLLLRQSVSSLPSNAAAYNLGAIQLGICGLQRHCVGRIPPLKECNPFRTFSSDNASKSNIQVAGDMLKQVNMLKLRSELQGESRQSLYISLEKFKQLAISSGAATSESEAMEMLEILHKAGIVFHHNNQVYLQAEEIAEIVMLALPGGKESAEEKLAKVEAELAELDKVHDAVEVRSKRATDIFLTCGLAILVTQFIAFIYLTWWELSWDVMEPFSYIISLFYSVVAYTYFLFTRDPFDLRPFSQYWISRLKDRKIQEIHFDVDRWKYLRSLRDRYKRHLAHVPRR